MVEPTTTTPVEAIPLHPEVFTTDAKGQWQLAGTRCRTCGAHFFPRRTVCAKCLSSDTEVVPLSTRGRLYTYTVVHQSTPEFRVPYVLGYVDLPEGVRVLASLVDVEVDRMRIGMPLELRVEPLRTDAEGRSVIGYRLHSVQEVRNGE